MVASYRIKRVFYSICFFALITGLIIYFNGYLGYNSHKILRDRLYDLEYLEDIQEKNENLTDSDIAKFQSEMDTIVGLDELQMYYGILLSGVSTFLLFTSFVITTTKRARSRNKLVECPYCKCKISSNSLICPYCNKRLYKQTTQK